MARRTIIFTISALGLLLATACDDGAGGGTTPEDTSMADMAGDGMVDTGGDTGTAGDATDTTADGGDAGCTSDADCPDGTCDTTTGECQAATCDDGAQNGDETDVDCGGGTCDACEVGAACSAGSDCASGVCDAGLCAAGMCGDGVVQTGEACDDGNDIDDDECTNQCSLPTCGDGIVQMGEQCDDGNDDDTDMCLSTCISAECGDGVVQSGEDCDGGGVETDTCNTDCTAAMCGDGVLNMTAGETCDDGGESSDCNDDCTAASCGDGIVNTTAGETCDDMGESATCDLDCTAAMCGDSVVNTAAGELCDDGGESSTCNDDCTEAMCGDGVHNATAGEACDDGGESATCDTDCTLAECGDGIANTAAGETCDDAGESASCDTDCTAAECGDGIVNTTAGEDCEDGNMIDDDACSNSCQAAGCSDMVQNQGETDIDCGGPNCGGCTEGGTCAADSDCLSGWCNSGTCMYRESCQAILAAGGSTGDGQYRIDPNLDGADSFMVDCDMTTDGGGWTLVTPTVANQNFGITLTDNGDGGCTFDGDKPSGHIPGTLNCRYDIDISFDFNTMRTVGVEFVAVTGGGANTTDVSEVDNAWGQPYCTVGSATGDSLFGTPAHGSGTLSLGRADGNPPCGGTFTSYSDGEVIGWPDEEAWATIDNVLRLEMGENGGQDEGYRWDAGAIALRLDTPIKGNLSQISPGLWADDTYAESCQEYLEAPGPYVYGGATGDGYYLIQPPGSTSPFAVFCDMTTEGGGWTAIDTVTARNGFNSSLTELTGNGITCDFSGDSPQAVGTAGFECRYDITTGFQFNTVRVVNGEIEALSSGTNTSDLIHYDGPWGRTNCASSTSVGDVVVGSVAHGEHVLSLGDSQGAAPCASVGGFTNGSLIAWSGMTANTTRGNTFRMEFGEAGGQVEGWRWNSGQFFVRDEIAITGGLTQADPGIWEDGSMPANCNGYVTRGGWYSAPVPDGDGWYQVDWGNGPTTVYCDMTTDGGGWTRVIKWDAQNDGDTLADFTSVLNEDFNNMGQFDDKTGFIRWSDADSTYDAMDYSQTIDVPNGGEILLDVNYTGTSMEASGVWFYATAGIERNLLCWDDASTTSGYQVSELALTPIDYNCPNNDPALTTITWTWDRLVQDAFANPITSVHVTSLHADCCVDGGDSSDLYRYTTYVR